MSRGLALHLAGRNGAPEGQICPSKAPFSCPEASPGPWQTEMELWVNGLVIFATIACTQEDFHKLLSFGQLKGENVKVAMHIMSIPDVDMCD